MPEKEIIKVIKEAPEELNAQTVIHWSHTYQELLMMDKMGTYKTYAIRDKAQKFVELKCITYDKEKKCYLCLPIPNYNKTTYEMRPRDGGFVCSCQFHNQVIEKQKVPGLICSHVLALKLQLKIWNWAKQRKEYKAEII